MSMRTLNVAIVLCAVLNVVGGSAAMLDVLPESCCTAVVLQL
jgi:hypothetical protein